MAKEIVFEVHVSQKGRWEIQGRHGASEMKDAIADARSLDELGTVDMVKVILEEYDDETGKTKESIVYRSAGMEDTEDGPTSMASTVRAEKNAPISPSSSFFDDTDDPDDFLSQPRGRSRTKSKGRRGSKGKKKTTFVGLLVKILLDHHVFRYHRRPDRRRHIDVPARYVPK